MVLPIKQHRDNIFYCGSVDNGRSSKRDEQFRSLPLSFIDRNAFRENLLFATLVRKTLSIPLRSIVAVRDGRKRSIQILGFL